MIPKTHIRIDVSGLRISKIKPKQIYIYMLGVHRCLGALLLHSQLVLIGMLLLGYSSTDDHVILVSRDVGCEIFWIIKITCGVVYYLFVMVVLELLVQTCEWVCY